MNKRAVLLPLAVIGIAVVIASAMVARKPPVQTVHETRPAPAVQFQLAQPQHATLAVESQGTVTPVQQVALTSEVAGRVVWVAPTFRLGERVRKDELLLKIDTATFELSVANATAALRDAELALAQEQARSAQASEDWQSVESGEAPALSQRLPQLNAARARVDAASAQLKKAQQDLTRCEIRAPFEAIVDSKAVELGQFITSNTQVAQLLGVARAEVRLPVAFERSLLLAPPGKEARVELRDEARPDVIWPAVLTRIDQQIDADTRVVYATAIIDQPYAQHPPLRLGQFVRATLPGKTLPDAVRLPRQAVFRDHGTHAHVFTVTDNNTLQRAGVEILATEPGSTVVGGLAAGIRVVVTRLDVMADGMQVTPSPAPAAGAN